MSQENVEIVRAGLEAFNREDWDAVLEHAAPDFVLDMSRAIGPEQRGTYKLDEVRSFLEDLRGTFESFRIDADDFIEAGWARRGAHHCARSGAGRDRGHGPHRIRVHAS